MDMKPYKTGEDRQADSALKSGLSALEREKKKQTRKMIIRWIITQIVSGLIILIKIALPIIIFLIIYTSISGVISDWIIGDEDDEEQQDPSNPVEPGTPGDPSNPGDSEKGIDVTQANYIWTQEQITNFINNYDTSNSELKNKILNKTSDIKKWQDNYGYGAGVLIASAIEDNISDFNRFLELFEQKAAKWKQEGYTGIYEIARDYVGNDTAKEWANNIINKISKTATDSGIFTEGTESYVSGDGYDRIYTSKSGKQYRNYRQDKGSYAYYTFVNNKTAPAGQVWWDGCALTSAAVIISGYTGQDIDPKDVVISMTNGNGFYDYPDPTTYLTHYGISASRPHWHNYTELSSTEKQNIINNLIAGKPVIIYVLGPKGNHEGYKGRSIFTDSQHWMALLDYKQSTDQVYLSNPSGTGGEGWMSRETVLTSCTEYILVNN